MFPNGPCTFSAFSPNPPFDAPPPFRFVEMDREDESGEGIAGVGEEGGGEDGAAHMRRFLDDATCHLTGVEPDRIQGIPLCIV